MESGRYLLHCMQKSIIAGDFSTVVSLVFSRYPIEAHRVMSQCYWIKPQLPFEWMGTPFERLSVAVCSRTPSLNSGIGTNGGISSIWLPFLL